MEHNQSLIRELWDYMRIRKRYWLLPIFIVIGIAGILIVFGQSSVISPFIYVMF